MPPVGDCEGLVVECCEVVVVGFVVDGVVLVEVGVTGGTDELDDVVVPVMPNHARSMASCTGTVCPTPAAEYPMTWSPYVVLV